MKKQDRTSTTPPPPACQQTVIVVHKADGISSVDTARGDAEIVVVRPGHGTLNGPSCPSPGGPQQEGSVVGKAQRAAVRGGDRVQMARCAVIGVRVDREAPCHASTGSA